MIKFRKFFQFYHILEIVSIEIYGRILNIDTIWKIGSSVVASVLTKAINSYYGLE